MMKGKLLFLLIGVVVGALSATWYFVHQQTKLYDSYLRRQEALKGTISEPARLDVDDLYNLKLHDPDGKAAPSIRESKDKVIFVGFWATWCMPCQAEFPEIEKLRAAVDDRVAFYMLSDESPELIRPTASKYKLPFFSYGDEKLLPNYLRTYPVLPRSFILRNGRIEFERWGNAPWGSENAIHLLRELEDDAAVRPSSGPK
jgi:thiol-disulfide isomerase/thioredoxin